MKFNLFLSLTCVFKDHKDYLKDWMDFCVAGDFFYFCLILESSAVSCHALNLMSINQDCTIFKLLGNWHLLFTLRDKSLRTLCTRKQVFSLKKCTIKKP